MTLRLRFAIFTSAFIAVILSAVAVSVYLLTERSLAASVEERAGQALVDLSGGAIATGLQRLPGDAYYQIVLVETAPALPESVSAIRNGVDYTQPASVRTNPTADSLLALLPDRALQSLVDDGDLAGYVTLASQERLRVLGALGTIAFPNQQVALTAVILVGLPTSNLQVTLDQLAQDLGLTVLVAFLAFAFGVWWLARRVLAPVQRVTQAAAQVSSKDLQRRVPVPATDDELRALALSINLMLDRLQESFETQRRFTADASHELRTPVTAIVGHAQYLLRRTQPSAEQADSLHVIQREGERMAKLVHDLLELARADAGFQVRREPMNLVEVLEAVRDELVPLGSARIVVDCAVPLLEVDGDPARLKQVVLNLVQNAIDAGAKTVTLHLERDGREVRFEVFDDGPGIPSEALPHVFERFYRVDGARSSRGNGSGLGLAIVRWIVQQHGGTVDVVSRTGEGTVFTVMLPGS
ncbi:MAG: ATP-binding protein [bacterium]|nr:ATP-binding protein [bacterium]